MSRHDIATKLTKLVACFFILFEFVNYMFLGEMQSIEFRLLLLSCVSVCACVRACVRACVYICVLYAAFVNARKTS